MKYFLFLMTALASHSAIAQISANQVSVAKYKEMAQKQTYHMKRFLSLEKNQSDSIAVINKDYYYQIASLQNKKMKLPERKKELLAIENTWNASLKKNLDPGQYKRYFDHLQEGKMKWQYRQDSLQLVRSKIKSK